MIQILTAQTVKSCHKQHEPVWKLQRFSKIQMMMIDTDAAYSWFKILCPWQDALLQMHDK
jgi:hypothetical protein